MEAWQAIAAIVFTGLGLLGAGVKWALGWVDKRDAAFLAALEKSQARLEAVNELRVNDARTYATALSDAVNKLQDALERRQSERPSPR